MMQAFTYSQYPSQEHTITLEVKSLNQPHRGSEQSIWLALNNFYLVQMTKYSKYSFLDMVNWGIIFYAAMGKQWV